MNLKLLFIGFPTACVPQASREARVAAFVKDLLDADEDEAELPARAMRRPVVLAAAVQSASLVLGAPWDVQLAAAKPVGQWLG